MTTDKDLAVAREMLDAEIAAMTRTLAERDALCEQQTRTIHGIPALMRERDAEKARADAAEQELSDAWAATGVASTVRGLTTLADVASTWREERDDAEQMVCEMRGVLRYYATRDFDSRGYSDSQLQAPADAALARTEPVAGRWVPVAEHADAVRAVISRQERIEALEAERDAAIAAKDAAESREHALGVQVVAAQAEAKRLLDDVKDLKRFMLAQWRPDADHVMGIVERIIAGGDAVPGDALAICKPGLQVGVDSSGVDVERVSVPAYEGEDEVTP